MRPASGLCAKCHRPLPDEWERPELTRATDICGMCGMARLSLASQLPGYKAWMRRWEDKHDSWMSVLGVPKRQRMQQTR